MPVVELRPVQWKRLTQPVLDPSTQIRVDPKQFLELLISPRRLTRADALDSGLCGLIDHEDGAWYTAAESELPRRPR